MRLSKIVKGAPNIEIKALNTDSRKQCEKSMFFCLDGFLSNGHLYMEDAIKHGAVCIVHSEPVKTFVDGITYIQVEDVATTLNQCLGLFYDFPSHKMLMFGVTGTNGKSTVTSIMKDIYDHFAPCGYIGTISIAYNDVVLEPNLTTPDAIYLNETLETMYLSGVQAVALEVSSHGLEQQRVDAIDFDVAVFTNFTHDHLDFHGSLDAYFQAKLKLFTHLKKEGIAVLNADDSKYSALCKATRGRVVSYGIENKCDYKAHSIEMSLEGSRFVLEYKGSTYPVETNLVATYNIYNLLAAIAAIVESGKQMEEVLYYVRNLHQVEGRMEIIKEGQPFQAIVDFAHTPDGLEKVFQFAKQITTKEGKILAVFGSAGRRDKQKRKTFGEIASKYCDTIILTEDDPRDEKAKDIAEEIKSGISTDVKNIFIEDRYNAIRQAIEQANPNDCVLVLGKGDELFMYREEGKSPWIGDHNALKEIIRKYYL